MEQKSMHEVVGQATFNYQQLVDKFIAVQDINQVSRGTYRSGLRQFFLWLEEEKDFAHNPTRETILAYKAYLDAKGLRPFTRANYMVVVRRFFEWAESLKIYPNIAKGVKSARRVIKSHNKDSLSIDQLVKVLGSINQKTLPGARDYALINLLVRTGLRLIEIVRADIGDIQYESENAILWIRGKGKEGKDDFVVLIEETLVPIQRYLSLRKARSSKEPLFGSISDRNYGKRLTTFSISRLIKNYFRTVGFNNRRLTAHSLRHTFGVLAIQAGASLHEVQLALRHTSPTTTEIYLGDIERLKRLEGGPEKLINALLNAKGLKGV